MTDLAVVRWIRELDENGAVALARALILAEAGAHGLSLDEFTMSGRVKAADEGVDGRTLSSMCSDRSSRSLIGTTSRFSTCSLLKTTGAPSRRSLT